MKIIGLKELKANPEKVARELRETEEDVIVVKRSRPLFRIQAASEEWERVVDFTSIEPGGVGIEEVLASLKRLDEAAR